MTQIREFVRYMRYKFNNIEIDTEKFSLLINGKEKSVEPQVFNLIVYLIESRNKIVSRDEILDNIWQGRIVSETSVNNHIKSARKVLGDDGHKQQVIKTIHSRGYQFIAEIEACVEATNSVMEELNPSKPHKLLYRFTLVFLSIVILILLVKQQNQTSQISQISQTLTQDIVPRSLAVLPLTNSGKDTEADYLGFALTDQIIGTLLYNRNIQVKPSTFVRKFDQHVVDPIAIGKQLKVQYILSGNYLKQGDLLRINFELVEVESNELIWRESRELSHDNIFKIQDTIADLLAQKLDLGLTSSEYFLNKNQKPMNANAYNYYLRSIAYPQTEEGNKQALKLLDKAFAIEPKSAQIITQLAARYRFNFSDVSGTIKAKEYLLKALAINPKYFTALGDLSRIYYDTGEFLKSYELVRRMLIINPKHSAGYYTLGKIYRKSGMIEDSIKVFKKALSLERNTDISNQVGASLFSNSQYQEARKYFNPETKNAASLAWQGSIALRLGENKKAFDFFQKNAVLYPDNYWGKDAVIFMAIINGDIESGLQKLQQQEKAFTNISEPTYFLASQYAAFGDKDNALRLYEKAVKDGYYNLSMMHLDPFFDFLRNDTKYIEIFNYAKQKHLAFKQAIADDL